VLYLVEEAMKRMVIVMKMSKNVKMVRRMNRKAWHGIVREDEDDDDGGEVKHVGD
jgi:hypothetical protein